METEPLREREIHEVCFVMFLTPTHFFFFWIKPGKFLKKRISLDLKV
jgi:hypothetical protein